MTDEQPIEEQSQPVFSLPDIPLPEVVEDTGVQDTFQAANKVAIIGAGQGGSRIAETFWNLGYRRVCVVNSTENDSKAIRIPEANKFGIGSDGAGKDRDLGRKYAEDHREDILDLIRRSCGTDFDRMLVCIGAGGGTGAGGIETILDVATEWAGSSFTSSKGGTRPVGAVVALPLRSEGQRPARNANEVLRGLLAKAGGYSDRGGVSPEITPLIVIDNERIHTIYPNIPTTRFWGQANTSICTLYHLFNLLACQDSDISTFDKRDYETVLNSGVIVFGSTPLSFPKDQTAVSFAIRNNLKKNILSGGFDFRTGSVAACVFVGDTETLDQIPQNYFDHGFEMMSRLLGPNSTVHRGIYRGDRKGLAVYTIVGGLGAPEERLRQLALDGNISTDKVDGDNRVY